MQGKVYSSYNVWETATARRLDVVYIRTVLVEGPEGKRSLRKPRSRYEDIIKMVLQNIK